MFPNFEIFKESTMNLPIGNNYNNQIITNNAISSYSPESLSLFNNEVSSEIESKNIINKNDEGISTPMIDNNNSYVSSYEPVLNELNKLNIEVKTASNEVMNDINILRNQGGKNKYNNLANMMSTYSSLVSTRLNIIKEAGSIINNSHNLDLKRSNQISKLESNNNQNDDAIIMNLYGMMSSNFNPSIASQEFNNSSIDTSTDEERKILGQLYDEYLNNFNKLNAEVVVLYNEANGVMEFKTVDENGSFINGSNMPSSTYLSNIIIDKGNGIAKDKHLGTVYRLVLVNESYNDEF